MKTINAPEELESLAREHRDGGQVVIAHSDHDHPWQLFRLEWRLGIAGSLRAVWMAEGGRSDLDLDRVSETAPAYVLEPASSTHLLVQPELEDAAERALRVVEDAWTVEDWEGERSSETIIRALADAGLLATPLTLPSREALIEGMFRANFRSLPWENLLDHERDELERSADAVLALLTGQTEAGEDR